LSSLHGVFAKQLVTSGIGQLYLSRCVPLTLCADQYDGYLGCIAKMCHLGVVTVDGVEARLILQTEDEHDRIDPVSELEGDMSLVTTRGHLYSRLRRQWLSQCSKSLVLLCGCLIHYL